MIDNIECCGAEWKPWEVAADHKVRIFFKGLRDASRLCHPVLKAVPSGISEATRSCHADRSAV